MDLDDWRAGSSNRERKALADLEMVDPARTPPRWDFGGVWMERNVVMWFRRQLWHFNIVASKRAGEDSRCVAVKLEYEFRSWSWWGVCGWR